MLLNLFKQWVYWYAESITSNIFIVITIQFKISLDFSLLPFEVSMQNFSETFRKRFFLYSYSFQKDLSREYLVVLKFLLEVRKFKENVLICLSTVIKVHDLLLTLLQVIVSKMSEHRLLKLINTSHIINYYLSCLDYFHFLGYNSFSSEICIVLQWNSHISKFLYLISSTKVLFEFFSIASRFSAKSVGKHFFKSTKYHQKEVYLKCF